MIFDNKKFDIIVREGKSANSQLISPSQENKYFAITIFIISVLEFIFPYDVLASLIHQIYSLQH